MFDSRVKGAEVLDAHRWYKGETRIGMVVAADDGAGRLLLFWFLAFGAVIKQVSGFSSLLLGKILGQWIGEVVCLGSVITRLTRIQLAASEANIEVTPEGSIVLNSLGNGKLGIDSTLFGAVAHVEVLFLQHNVLSRGLRDGDRVEGWRKSHDDIDMAVLGPNWGNLARNRSILRALIKLGWTKLEGGNVAQIGCNGDGLACAGIGHLNASLIFGKEVGQGKVEPKVNGTAKKKFVEVESLFRHSARLTICSQLSFSKTFIDGGQTYMAFWLSLRLTLGLPDYLLNPRHGKIHGTGRRREVSDEEASSTLRDMLTVAHKTVARAGAKVDGELEICFAVDIWVLDPAAPRYSKSDKANWPTLSTAAIHPCGRGRCCQLQLLQNSMVLPRYMQLNAP